MRDHFRLIATTMARGRASFGLSSARGGTRGRGNFRAGYRGGSSWRGRGRRGGARTGDTAPVREDDGSQLAEKFEKAALNDEIDEKLGFARVQEGIRREGWLVNMHPVGYEHLCTHNNTKNQADFNQRSRLVFR